jgi:hypothetical protein
MALHDGQVAEMATGEGKTLVATLPAYLNALPGHSVHIVTVNDYLAVRDADWWVCWAGEDDAYRKAWADSLWCSMVSVQRRGNMMLIRRLRQIR